MEKFSLDAIMARRESGVDHRSGQNAIIPRRQLKRRGRCGISGYHGPAGFIFRLAG